MMAARRMLETKSGRMVTSQRRDKLGSSKKLGAAEKLALMSGWNLPLVPDENDIVCWMAREKNGDNIKKPRRDEEVPEEQYRHMFSRCKTVENQMEFERESLHEKYRKHCQFGPVLSEDRRRRDLKLKTAKGKDSELGDIPERTLTFPRSCKSAELPSTPKVSTLTQRGLEDGCMESQFPTRSHSVIDDTKLKAYGLTLPPDEKTARLLELAGKFIAKAELASKRVKGGQEDQQDEGYDSKVSSNDTEVPDDDVEGSKVAHCDETSEYTNLDSIVNDQSAITTLEPGEEGATNWSEHIPEGVEDELEAEKNVEVPETVDVVRRLTNGYRPRGHPSVHQVDSSRDAIAKLMYSRRDRTVYERMSGRGVRNKEFRYAGKEQSRLMETSLNQVTPGYMNMHQFANLSNFMQYPNFHLQMELVQQQLQQQQIQPQHHAKQQKQQQEEQQHDESQPKPVVLTRISLQDSSNPDICVSANEHSSPNGNSGQETHNNANTHNGNPLVRHHSDRLRSGKKVSNVRLERSNSAKHHSQTGDQSGALSDNPPRKEGHARATNIINEEAHLSLNPANTHNGVTGGSRVLAGPVIDGYISSNRRSYGRKQVAGAGSSLPLSEHAPSIASRDALTVPTLDSSRSPRSLSPNNLDTSRTVDSSNQPLDKTFSTTCFPVADLLPAVERNLRRRGVHGMGKQHVLYRSHSSLDPTYWKQAEGTGGIAGSMLPSTASCQELYSSLMGPSHPADGGLFRRKVRTDERNPGGIPLILHTKGPGPPGFRPHNSLSPLQRAKEIVNRRLHGHVRQLPDGSETIHVSSPHYQTTKMDRINSASRQLDRIISGTWKQQ